MTKLFWNALKFSPVVFAATFFASNSALAGEAVTSVSQLTQASKAQNIGQVTSVSQFSDVQPTDWAFQALQSLVERYGCIAGYPNGTYRGNRALTRYEFAAGLNACLDRVNELIATATADLVSKQDLATLQRLQEEFSAELATLRGRVDALEARTAELEANQFSTTTKLSGEAIFSVSQAFGDTRALPSGSQAARSDLDSNLAFANRVRLTLNSSFTGTDQLQTRLNAGNIIANNANNIGNASTGTNMTRLGYDGGTDNSVTIDKLNYAFNLSDSIRVKIDATGAELNENANVFNPDFRSSGSGALSRYGRFSPIYRQANDGAGITVNVNPNGPLTFTAAYVATGRNNAANPADGNGLFDGNNAIFGQVSFKPNQALNLGFAYARTYQQTPNLFGSTGSSFANNPFAGARTEANHYGFQATFQPSSTLTLGGWVGYTTAEAVTGANRDADAFYWAASLGIKDFGREGNTLGLIFGQPPKITGGNNIASESGTSYHLEGLYKLKLTDNILVTPGLLVIFNPENNNNNDTIYVGTLRTTFTF
ncbi:S-layer region-like protein [Trichormus variabilis ATCC 29413]|uniref:S-layer region-like protein n=2 Tax=Anabaena variabilis TaxID=264691 RepID=Q3M7R4_TRIV2|nr:MULTISPECIES: iron uptake porin [Nostocaceae]ABA22972.1 S-layer region-like protein [Trichormus variabilis ATCC 29413]MBC1213840.1 iron uptake porin [Trichormus variabilis ARAD]MBC1256756.1 iron uptake porin [Trichormus variabilis V5]MBC1266437.1 iron uptake porin [Trichormus variabilis FSR]MBC1302607.1 iron uptake porin [Trichormus variabilis N2B]